MKDVDRNIIELASQGDISAFETIYKETSSFVYNVALRINRNSFDAEEVVQNVFMKVHSNLKNFAFRSTFKTWLYRITVNTAINVYRKTSGEQRRMVDYEEVSQTLSEDPLACQGLAKSDDEARLNRILGGLSPKHRACIILREIEGLSYGEIARILKVPINTVRSRLKRARQALLDEAKKGDKYAL